MHDWIFRKLISDYADVKNPAVRDQYGRVAGVVGILSNTLLCVMKILVGLLSSSIAIVADAVNNLADASSSLITLIGFKLAAMPEDKEHPYGHARIEYLAGLLVSVIIIVVGLELGKSSVEKIIHPVETELTVLTAVILLCAVAVKLWMAWFNGALSRRIRSDALAATAADSRSDAVATGVVLLGLIVTRVTGWQLDGWLGLLVAVFIVKTGVSAAKDTIDPLLGKAPDPEMVKAIEDTILSHPQVVGVHDLIIHDYGPGRRMMSVHAEVPADADLLEIHDVIDQIERELHRDFRMDAVIHMDPIQIGNPEVDRLRALTARLAADIDPDITIHDFRITAGPLHTNLIFDIVVPYTVKLSGDEVKRRISQKLREVDETYTAVIDVDRSYVL